MNELQVKVLIALVQQFSGQLIADLQKQIPAPKEAENEESDSQPASD